MTPSVLFLKAFSNDVIKDTTLLKFFKEVDNMPDDLKNALLKVIEAYVQNYRAKQAFS
jgi:hypothetical protein